MPREQDVEVLFAQNPRAGIRFLRPLLVLGSVISLVLSVLDLHILSQGARDIVGLGLWEAGGGLRGLWTCGSACGLAGFWLGAKVVLQIVQLPIRVLLLQRLNVAAEVVNDEAAAMHLLALNRSVAWKANKRLGAINLAWFVLGFLIDWQTLGGPCKLHWLILLHFGCVLRHATCRPLPESPHTSRALDPHRSNDSLPPAPTCPRTALPSCCYPHADVVLPCALPGCSPSDAWPQSPGL